MPLHSQRRVRGLFHPRPGDLWTYDFQASVDVEHVGEILAKRFVTQPPCTSASIYNMLADEDEEFPETVKNPGGVTVLDIIAAVQYFSRDHGRGPFIPWRILYVEVGGMIIPTDEEEASGKVVDDTWTDSDSVY